MTFWDNWMARAGYDPGKAHDYYERTKHLKGRQKGAGDQPAPHHASQAQVASAQQKVAAIQAKLGRLRELLHQKIADEKKSGGSKPSTQADKIKERQASKRYRDQHANEIKNDRKAAASKGGGSSTGGKTASSMSASELRTAISHTVAQLKSAIQDAQRLRGGGG
jgi:hypothetical protein